MEIRNWHIKDIYFNNNERLKAEREVKRFEKDGWYIESDDLGGDYDNCIQIKKDGHCFIK